MHASDVIVTKAGPGTICEALACNLPVILSGYVPGQEEGNVTYVVENNVGVLAYDSVELIDTLRRLLKPGSQLRRQQVENAKRISRPRASFDIANYILSFLPPAGAPGVWQSTQGLRQRRKLSRLPRTGGPVRKIRPGLQGLRRASARVSPNRLPRLTFLRRPVHSPLQLRSQATLKHSQDQSPDS